MAESDIRFRVKSYIRLAELASDDQRQIFIAEAVALLDLIAFNAMGADQQNKRYRDNSTEKIERFLQSYDKEIVGRPAAEIYDDFCAWCDENDIRRAPGRTSFGQTVCSYTGFATKPKKINRNVVRVYVERCNT